MGKKKKPDPMEEIYDSNETLKNKVMEDVKKIAIEWQSTFDAIDDVVWILDKDNRIVRSNKAVEHFFGCTPDEIIGKQCWEVAHDTRLHGYECPVSRLRKSLRRETLDMQIGNKWVEITADPILDGKGQYTGAVHIISDISKRKQAEERLQSLLRISQYDTSDPQQLLDYTLEEAIKLTLSKIGYIYHYNEEKQEFTINTWSKGVMDVCSVSERQTVYALEKTGLWGEAVRQRKPIIENNFSLPSPLKKGMPEGHAEIKKFLTVPVFSGDRIVSVVGVANKESDYDQSDVLQLSLHMNGISKTLDRMKAETALHESEDQLRQSQKMEAVGRLAGGIAHDFNNMLTVINNYAEFVIDALKKGDPLRSDVEEILKAGQRSADLTHQLLAFSRRQVLAPEILDMNKIVSGIEPMIRRLIGEDIHLVFSLTEDIGNVKADPGQIEQVIVNLVVNSRDAMPDGGKITVGTRNIELDREYKAHHLEIVPGQYVELSVSDTGSGMDKETARHIFEPFFTTKESGKGTGLGLSTVYGIVKQSGGDIWLYSEESKGTTFKIYLPRELSEVEFVAKAKKKDKPAARGTETILVVEDEPGVLNLIKRVLESSGYTIYTADNGGKAFLTCERIGDSIQLLITDIVMPDMGGRELVARLSEICPKIKVLYMSGYTEDAIVHHNVLDHSINFISKPFTLPALTSKVRAILDK